MAYKIATSAHVPRSVRETAAREVARALDALGSVHRRSHDTLSSWRDAAVAAHEARRRFKRVRALLRLARAGLGPRRFKREDHFFRDAGRGIREVRDSAALLESIDALKEIDEANPVVSELRFILLHEAQACARDAAPLLAASASALQAELDRIHSWRLKGFGWKEARSAACAAWDVCRKACEAALRDPSTERLHAWRKRAKDALYELQLVRRGTDPASRRRCDGLQSLCDLLGQDHDLALLAQAAEARRPELAHAAELDLLLASIGRRRRQLQRRAFTLAATWWRIAGLVRPIQGRSSGA